MVKKFSQSSKYSLSNVTLESFEDWTFCLARGRFHLSFVGLSNSKEACKDDQVHVCLLTCLCERIARILFSRKNMLNLCQSILILSFNFFFNFV